MTRLQFRHHIEVFSSREDAISFLDGLVNNESGAAPIGESKMGEPILVTYLDKESKKHAILAIGKNEGGTGVPYQYIDTDYLLERIDDNSNTIKDIEANVDQIKQDVSDLNDKVEGISRDIIKEIIINDLPADIQNNIARLVIGAKDIKLADYIKAADPKDALHDTDSVNVALGKLEAKSDNNDERIKELEKIQPDEITIIKTPKDKDNIFLSTNLSIKKMGDNVGANIQDRYQLVDGKDNKIGDEIIIYKDSRLVGVNLLTDDKGRATILEFNYLGVNGEEIKKEINVADFLQEAEFKTGLAVVNGEVFVKRDPSSEDFFTISDDGLKVSGINDAITNAVKAETDRATAKETELSKAISDEVTRATKAESVLSTKIDDTATDINGNISEVSKTLEGKITESFNNVNTKLEKEITRSAEQDTIHDNAIKVEKDRLDGEIARSKEQDAIHSNAIKAEETRAANAEQTLDTKIDTEIAKVLASAKDYAHSEDDKINNALTEEINRAKESEKEIKTSVDTLTTDTQAKINDAITTSKGYTDEKVKALSSIVDKNQVAVSAPITIDTTGNKTLLGLSIEQNRILSVINGALSTTLQLAYDPNSWDIKLLGVNDKVLTTLSAKQFVKSGLIKSITVDTINNVKYLVITYENIQAGEDTSVKIPLAELFSPYIASNGIEIKEESGKANVISVKVDKTGDGKFITLSTAGLGLNGITDAISIAKTELSTSIKKNSDLIDSLETRMSGDENVDGSVAHKISDAKNEIRNSLISKTVTEITPEAAAEQTLLKKISKTGNVPEFYVSNNTADMSYRGASLQTTIDDMKEFMEGLNATINAIANRLTKLEEAINNIDINLVGTAKEIKVTKTGSQYQIGFDDDAIFGPIN